MNCRICGGDRFGEVIDLGRMPLVNNLMRSADEIAERWPLHVKYCRECSLMQLTASPPPSAMFDQYLYFSSQSQTMVDHARRLVEQFVKPGDCVLEIASNDGYLLREALNKAGAVLGVEPARNVAEYANSVGVPTRCAYFNQETAAALREDWGMADVIFANNVLAHVPDPNEIAAGIGLLLAAGGVAHIEVPSAVRMIESGAFDTIYHEHFSYFTLTALHDLFCRHGLKIIGIDEIPIHGGSFHLRIARKGDEQQVEAHLQRERLLGVRDDPFHRDFEDRVRRIRRELDETIAMFDRVVAMGAAAKGIVLLNCFRLDRDRVAWVADVSPHKQGRFIPGTGQPIVAPSKLVEEMPDAALLLPWNLRDEILRRNRGYRDQGGRFIVPIPSVEIV